MKPGLLMFVLREDNLLFVRFFHFIGFSFVKVNDEAAIGGQFSIMIWKFQFGINITRKRGDYVERIKNETGPKASA